MYDLWRRERVHSSLVLLALCLGLLVWLWPIGIGGQMPVGGDVTQFSLGLMAELARAIRAGRLPVWNDLWGYGFPGLAESQMGVYYPPHWLLYGLLPLEAAYTSSLVLHTLWGGLGAYWAARRFDISPAGAALTGFTWSTSGFFDIHLPHQWGYTVGSWMPWAWGLTWLVATRRGSRRTALLLSLVLTLQVLPGHFQLAFCTQAGVMVLAIAGYARAPGSFRGIGTVALALLATIPLAALQLWPTYRLARLATSWRDFDYLSGFAATPLHLVSYVAPGLFHRSPLWRPLVWDPFHTSPEEFLAYIGLAPLFFAVMAIRRGARRDPGIRALTIVAGVTLLFGLGPYVPGFDLWCRLPGFSFFRAPARWTLATGLALALLAGRGFDSWRSWPRPALSLVRFSAMAVVLISLVILAIELALASTERPGWPAIARQFESAMDRLPWPRKGDSFHEVMLKARQAQDGDQRVATALARQGRTGQGPSATQFARERFSIYLQELSGTGLLILGMLALAPLTARRHAFETGMIVLTTLDLLTLGRERVTDLGPIRPLVGQSGVLARLSSAPRGSRTVDSLRNMPMVAGAAPVAAYRTLDLPVLPALGSLAQGPLGLPDGDPVVVAALRAVGASFRILEPSPIAQSSALVRERADGGSLESIDDPALAGWLYGRDWVAQVSVRTPWVSRFTLWKPDARAAHAWFVPLTPEGPEAMLRTWSGSPAHALEVLRRASPLPSRQPEPGRLEVEVRGLGPGIIVVTQLSDPQWQARWMGPGGERSAGIIPVFTGVQQTGWQAIILREAGDWTLRMKYEAADVWLGLANSIVAWLVWILLFLRNGKGTTSLKGDTR